MEAGTARSREQAGVVIPAAGQGRRFGSAENKIWAGLGGRSVLEHTLDLFQRHRAISSIVVVSAEAEVERIEAICASFPRVCAVAAGGATRAESVRNGLAATPSEAEMILVHDAARPFASPALIDRVIEGVRRWGAAVPGIPVSDTVKRVDQLGMVCATVPRAVEDSGRQLTGLTAVQTPQGAVRKLLERAYKTVGDDFTKFTDEASLLEAAGIPVGIVPGDAENRKITTQEDLRSPPQWSRAGELRTGFGYDVHAFAPSQSGRKLMLGGIEIPHDRGLEGHSDADVLLHAVCDALLGAAALEDIGVQFPNSDPRYAGISSLELLAEVARKLQQAGCIIVNVDATVSAEAPKLAPHRGRIVGAIAGCLGVDSGRISVKATTAEGMGFVGRKEGICCWAVATVRI